ncbi:hypothetical protein JOD25_001673 [Kurthia huakuii]|nr:hypothetical protein [Kurthia huakuii]
MDLVGVLFTEENISTILVFFAGASILGVAAGLFKKYVTG